MTAAINDLSVIRPATREFLGREHRNFIDGQWCNAASGKTLAVFDPATGQPISRVADSDATDVNLAVDAARRAFEQAAWQRMKPALRERLLHRLADLMEDHIPVLAELESIDNGKSAAVAAAVDLPCAVDCLRFMAGMPSKLNGSTLKPSVPFLPDGELFAYANPVPVGVVGAIVPWNFPTLLLTWKIAPALAAGCTVVLKPAEETPLTALYIAKLAAEAGFPPGVINVVTGYGHTAGAAISGHPGIDKVTFTGSTEVGRLILQAATGNLKKVTLELGGKSPAIVLPDADLDIAIPGAASGIFFNHGQVCTAGSRLYVHRSRFDQVVEGVADIARHMKVGPGLDPANEIGPLVSKVQQERVCAYIASGRDCGAEIIAGGDSPAGDGFFVNPTVFINTRPDMKIVREEIFGPVLVASPYDDIEEVIARANDTPYGLGASIWSRDVSMVHKIAPRIRAGTVWVNCHNVIDAALPFGGFKESGWGRENGVDAVRAYTETQTIVISL
ncbi:MAG: aldehyde dehydrogenase family protein [Gammaproteobacteria bacterium]|jgi:phenylacetaldehyde dehydrogenase|nr:aldehyde dehydrogenase family protein [Gammaproteobacteria bacterium]